MLQLIIVRVLVDTTSSTDTSSAGFRYCSALKYCVVCVCDEMSYHCLYL